MRPSFSALVISLVVVCSVKFVESCSSDTDCNADECLDCKCVQGSCSCADGWSGSACQTPFCTNQSQCNNHGTCVMTLHNISCQCDISHAGDRCQDVQCKLACVHGGQPNKNCTSCEGCYPGWTGPACNDFSNSTSPTDLLAAYTGI